MAGLQQPYADWTCTRQCALQCITTTATMQCITTTATIVTDLAEGVAIMSRVSNFAVKYFMKYGMHTCTA